MPKAPRKARQSANETICPIDNIPELVTLDDILDKPGQLETYRLERRNEELEQLIKIRNRQVEKALEIISAEVHYFRSGLQTNVWETYNELQGRLHRLESQMQSLLDTTSGAIEYKKIKTKWGNW
jgi:light-regulated signal transduction histidine kinase (bacteriophytochrome)